MTAKRAPLALFPALFALGLAFGVVLNGRTASLFVHATLVVFLPLLIFEAAWQLDARALRRRAVPIALLAVPGTLVSAALVAFAARWLAGAPWATAFALGAVLSATDPIAVVALFRRLRVPTDLLAIVEAESLFNDAVALALYRTVVVAIVAAHMGLTAMLGTALVQPLLSLGGGVLVGWAFGIPLQRFARLWFAILVTVLGAFIFYGAAERIGGSGIFAVIGFAVALRTSARLPAPVLCATNGVWWSAADLANALFFFLTGAAVNAATLLTSVRFVIVALFAVVVVRVVLSYGLLAGVRFESRWRLGIAFGGVRGALSLALALSFATTAPKNGSSLVAATYAVVAFTLFAGSVVAGPLLRRAGLSGG